jgi:hypothetical protein
MMPVIEIGENLGMVILFMGVLAIWALIIWRDKK